MKFIYFIILLPILLTLIIILSHSAFTSPPFTANPLESIMTSIPLAFIVTESLSVVIADSPTL